MEKRGLRKRDVALLAVMMAVGIAASAGVHATIRAAMPRDVVFDGQLRLPAVALSIDGSGVVSESEDLVEVKNLRMQRRIRPTTQPLEELRPVHRSRRVVHRRQQHRPTYRERVSRGCDGRHQVKARPPRWMRERQERVVRKMLNRHGAPVVCQVEYQDLGGRHPRSVMSCDTRRR